MVMVQINSNKTLKGHKLLLLIPWEPSSEYLARIQDQFPDLEIATHNHEWASTDAHTGIPDHVWKDVTILLTGSSLPEQKKAPKLEYVQLLSAGANHILKNPLFTDTEIAFCTANGVHG